MRCCSLPTSKQRVLLPTPQSEDSTTNMRFLRIDCGPLKQTLVGHCEQWVARFTGLLSQLAAQELKSLHDHFKQRWGPGSVGCTCQHAVPALHHPSELACSRVYDTVSASNSLL
jgi:hypothetical protein